MARPTERLEEVVRFYRDGLGLLELGGFHGHEGFDGITRGNLTLETTEPTEVVVERIETRPSPYSATLRLQPGGPNRSSTTNGPGSHLCTIQPARVN